MGQRRVTVTTALISSLLGLAATLTMPSLASAAPLRDQQACAATLSKAKVQEQTGSLLEAKDLLLSCSRAPCAYFVRQQCATGYSKLQADTPTIVFVITDASGASRSDVQVRIDGTPIEGPIDGRPIEIDPGFHDLSFIADGHVFAAQRIMVVQGQRNRFVTATVGGNGPAVEDARPSLVEAPVTPLRGPISTMPARTGRRAPAAAPAGKKPAMTETASNDAARTAPEADAEASGGGGAGETPSAAAPHGKLRWLPLAFTGLAVASVGAGALLTTWGRRDNDLLGNCAPSCSNDSLDRIRRRYTEADIAFGIGIAALGAAYWTYAIGHSGSSDSGKESALRLDVAPTRSGGVAAVSGSF